VRRDRGIEGLLPVDDRQDELVSAYVAARDTADPIERGEDVEAGDLAAAVENLRIVRRAFGAVRP
jgi:hypothetical protein